ncbi:type VII secretion protein EccB [Williamsia sp. CHRR-6]|uniref:type VII secretion protein EccB n=1 Tax=Williamsia sp. CHRR-6 TaxID=2835871 RepID=UPI001BDA2753|nr:type VII secretion protein EccB [Williamsia sp. CHRR-6]MBT0568581.1 type VII secretion protein EccB [Williamsia sp. CHRR-6]
MAQRTTKSQVSGYRFLLRRLEHALVRRDIRMIHDPMGAHVKALIVGLVMTMIVLGGAVALSFFKPQGSVGNSKILISKSSGQLYVLVQGTLHPVLNLASARLAVGKAEKPNSVADKLLKKYTRGPQLGIPGAPSSLSASGAPGTSRWAACDRLDEPRDPLGRPTVGVIAGALTPDPQGSVLGPNDAMLVRNQDDYYLLYRNTRAAVDITDNAVKQSLNLQDVAARAVSTAMLDAIPPTRQLAAPVIPNAGKPSRFDLAGARIGSIISVSSLGSGGGTQKKLYVVLQDGVELISPLVADLIRASQVGSETPIEVSLNAVTNVPPVTTLQLSGIPDNAPRLVKGTENKALCFTWSKNRTQPAQLGLQLTSDFPIKDPTAMVPTVGSQFDGVTADLAYIPAGKGYFVRSTGVDPNTTSSASDFLVSDTGVRYGVPPGAADPLGMPDPLPAPFAVVSLLPPGPTLARDGALVIRDDLAPTDGG